MKVLVTGNAGFIGSHTTECLLARGDEVVGIDNLNDYYDVSLKQARLERIRAKFDYHEVIADIADPGAVSDLIGKEKPDRVVHLAAQAGVRYSLDNPHAYIHSNITGHLNVLEACRQHGTEHLVYASTSSVYGANTSMPFSVSQNVDHPLSLYAASKKSNELMSHTYSHLFGIPSTGLRFFTVYGPWGRPDMALSSFTRKILAGEPIDVFNQGKHRRDFTYITDIVKGIVSTLDLLPEPDKTCNANAPEAATSNAPYRLYNIGSDNPIELMRCIELLESELGIAAKVNLLPLQPGDMPDTHADIEELVCAAGYTPSTPFEVGIKNFVEWYKDYYAIH